MNARLWLALALGCQPTIERDDSPPPPRYFTGAEWVLDADGNVVRTGPVLVDREAWPQGSIVRVTMKNGVLRIIELRPAHDGGALEKHIFELTPLTPEEFALRSRS